MKIITIGREFGSGGRELGKRLAEELGYAYYDEEIITAIAEKCGFAPDYVDSVVENAVSQIYPVTYGRTFCSIPVTQDHYTRILRAQEEVLHELASRSNCVIVGRCADYLLADQKPLKLFVYADMESKIRRCRFKAGETEDISDKQLTRQIKKVEAQRSSYYEDVTGQKWGAKENYHLCVNTSNPEANGKEIKTQVPAVAAFCKVWLEG